jgi:putative ABC transport system permease protein
MFYDFQFAIRQFTKSPGFALITMLSFALGIGVTTSVFTIINGTLLRSGPYREPDKLVFITPEKLIGGVTISGVSGKQLNEWENKAHLFAGMAAYDWTFNFLIHPDGNESLEGMIGTSKLFDVLGVHAIVGRTFTSEERSVKDHPVVLLGYGLWQRRFGADPGIIGKEIQLSRLPKLTVVGVMPAGIRFLPSRGAAQEPNYNLNGYVDYWLPESPLPTDTNAGWNVVARISPAVSLSQARAEMAVIGSGETKSDPQMTGMTVAVSPASAVLDGEIRRIVLPLFGAVCFVLMVAVANVAGLLLVRGLGRQKELAIRSALGASRMRILQLTLTESLLLAAAGGMLGVLFAFAATKLLIFAAPNAIPRIEDIHVDLRVLGFCVGISLLTGLSSGMLAAWQFLRHNVNDALKAGGLGKLQGPSGRRMLGCLIAGEVGLTLMLLIGAGLMTRTMMKLERVKPGYETHNILTMVVTSLKPNIFAFHKEALEKVSALPGVESAAFVWGLPLTGNQWRAPITIAGRPPSAHPQDQIIASLRSVTPDYFGLMGIVLRGGRLFTDQDRSGSPDVAIINEEMARRYFPNESPVGKFLSFGRGNPTEVVGVVGDLRNEALNGPLETEVYLAFFQAPAFSKHLVLRTQNEPTEIIEAARRELRHVDPGVVIEKVKTMDRIRDDSVSVQRFAMALISAFSVAALVLAAVGIYGVMSHSVAQRSHEFGIRMAIGAQRHQVFGLVLKQAFVLTLIGIVVGLVGAMSLTRVLRGMLFEVVPTDPLTFATVPLILVLTMLLASWIPADRATAIDPIVTLRSE